MRKLFRKYLPDSASVRRHRVVAAFGSTLQHPNLWHLNRDSVAKGVAIGLFTGLEPGPFHTNPFTIVPLYLVAYEYGRLLLGEAHDGVSVEPFSMDWTRFGESIDAFGHWALSLGKPLGVGLVALALSLAAAGYVAVRLGWRLYVVLAWRARQRRQARRTGA